MELRSCQATHRSPSEGRCGHRLSRRDSMAERLRIPVDPTDPVNMTPAARTAEIAAILALGVLRLRARAALPSKSSPVPSEAAESGRNCLDDTPETRLHVPRG